MSGHVDAEFKVILLGDSAVGKSKLVERYLVDSFVAQQSSTYALTVFRHQTKDGHSVDIWDTAGQECFNAVHPSYFHGAHCAILTFDVTRKLTYQHLETWYNELQSHRPGLPVLIAANKLDADPAAANKSFAFPKKHPNCVPNVYFVSAADGTNVVKLFNDACKFAARYKANPSEDDFSSAVLEALEYFDRKEQLA